MPAGNSTRKYGPRKRVDYRIGDKVDRWEIVGESFVSGYRGKQLVRSILCRCRCQRGIERPVELNSLIFGRSRSCGCLKDEATVARLTTHGGSDTRLYKIWENMLSRCYNPRVREYHNYGGRGIEVCPEWRHDFPAFRDWAMSHGYAEDLTIERRFVNLGYFAENCEFIPPPDQQANLRKSNRITAFGETKHKAAWVRDPRCKVSEAGLRHRIKTGWDPEAALTTPPTRPVFVRYTHSEDRRERKNRARRENPAKDRARTAVRNAVRDGRLTRHPCEICGNEDTQAHHDDYSKPLVVRWLCREHHRLADLELGTRVF